MIILFTGISGVECKAVLNKFINENQEYRYPNKKPIFLKMEEKIEDVFFAENPQAPRNKLSWMQLILQQPYPLLKQQWIKACKIIDLEIKDNQKEDPEAVIFVNLHASYFHIKTQEYISLVDLECIRALKPTKIITLIDDIYEIYHRLTKRGGLFNLMNKTTKTDIIFRHLRLLDWRAKETMMSRFISEQIENCKHFVFASKHPFTTMEALIKPEALTAYLSHPISEVRRLEIAGKEAEALTIQKEISEISKALNYGFATFLPTTIDEYRISNKKIAVNDIKAATYICLLNKRWEKDYFDVPQSILYQPCNFSDSSQLWDCNTSDSENFELSPLLSVLANSISFQVTTRDYTLVEQSDILILYRPLFNGNLAGGVQKEYNYFKHMQSARSKKALCFIYCPKKDSDQFVINEFNSQIKYFLSMDEGGLVFKKTNKKFDGLTETECGKLLNIDLDKNLILDFVTEFMDVHDLSIDESATIAPLKDGEVEVQEQFLDGFVSGLLEKYSKLKEYKTLSTAFYENEMGSGELYDNILKTVNHGK